jgi:hypothetical protein
VYAHERAYVKTQGFGLNLQARACNDARIFHFSNPLMNGSTRYAAFARDLKKGHTGILNKKS